MGHLYIIMTIATWIVGTLLILGAASIELRMTKRNLFIPQDAQYQSSLQLQRQNAQLIPTTLSLQTSITNSMPRFGDYFDYFYFLTPTDLQCYANAIQNDSFLFPCPFLTNHYSKNRISETDSNTITQQIDVISDVKFSFIVDNTLFPYPDGAYSYSNINIDVATVLDITVSPSYEILGTRLIFINATIFIIFVVIITIIIYKTRAISQKMTVSNPDHPHPNNTPYLHQMEDDNESSFVSEEDEGIEGQDRMMREGGREQEMFFHEEPMLTEQLRSSAGEDAKVKSGLIQYLGSRAEE